MKTMTNLYWHCRLTRGAETIALFLVISAFLMSGREVYGQAQDFAIFVDQKPANTNGGKCTAGSWLKRDLNTVYASFSPAIKLDSANSILTLEKPGTYRIRASAPATRVGVHQIRLGRIAGSAAPAHTYGSSEFSKAEDQKGDTTRSFIDGIVQVTSSAQFTVQHQCQKTNDGGFGTGNAFGGPNVFTQVFIERLSDAVTSEERSSPTNGPRE